MSFTSLHALLLLHCPWSCGTAWLCCLPSCSRPAQVLPDTLSPTRTALLPAWDHSLQMGRGEALGRQGGSQGQTGVAAASRLC